MGTIKLSKIEAIRRQIDASIRILFENEDPIAIHTLAMASFQMLRDLSAKSEDNYFNKMLKNMLNPSLEREFWRIINRPANFLKHADKDPNGIIDNVEEEVNEGILVISCLLYQDLGNHLTPEMVTLISWFFAIHPDFIKHTASGNLKQLFKTDLSYLRELPRHEQLKMGHQLIDLARDTTSGD